jgi:hypothetical protein
MGKQRKPEPTEETTEGRIRWLLEHHWSGNQSQMAADVHCSQSVISRVVRRLQPAGPRLLGNIGDHPKINKMWLLTGEGKPLMIPTSVPWFEEILPGPPQQHRDLCKGEYPVIPHEYSESRYFFKIGPHEPAVQSEIAKVRPGDFLLLECEAPSFLRLYPNFRGLAVIRQRAGSGDVPRLCRIWPEQTGRFNLDTFGADSSSIKSRAKANPVVRQITILEFSDGTTESHVEASQSVRRDPTPPRDRSTRNPKPSPTAGVDDILAVAVQLVRETP